MVTLGDIARQVGVSTSTVSRVLSGINKGVRTNATRQAQEIVRVARQLGYVFDQTRLTGVVDSGCHYVGLLMEGYGGAPWESEFLAGVQEVLRGSGFSLVLIAAEQLRDFRQLQQLYIGLDCVIVSHVKSSTRQELENLNVRVVWMDSGERRPFNCVYRDEYVAGEMAAQGMVDKGYQQLILVTGIPGPEKKGCFIERQAGVEAVAQRVGIPLISMTVGRDNSGKWDDDDFLRLLSKKNGAIALEIGSAMWCVGAAMERGMIAGRDFGLVSCGEMQIVNKPFPYLTRISFEREEIGRQAARMALELVHGKECPSRKVSSRWIEGATANSMSLISGNFAD